MKFNPQIMRWIVTERAGFDGWQVTWVGPYDMTTLTVIVERANRSIGKEVRIVIAEPHVIPPPRDMTGDGLVFMEGEHPRLVQASESGKIWLFRWTGDHFHPQKTISMGEAYSIARNTMPARAVFLLKIHKAWEVHHGAKSS